MFKTSRSSTKKCIRIVTKSAPLSHTGPLFKQFKLLKLRDIYQLKLATYAYSNCNFLNDHHANHDYETRFHNELRPSFMRLNLTQNSISYQIPKLWNTIPTEIKSLSSLNQFKKAFKLYLINKY